MEKSGINGILAVGLFLFLVICIALLGTTIITERKLGELRRDNDELGERNRDLEIANSRTGELLDGITGIVDDAQRRAREASGTIQRIEVLVSALKNIAGRIRIESIANDKP